MSQICIPENFLVRPAKQFVRAFTLVSGNYWYWHSKGEMRNETTLAQITTGGYEAIRWLAGQSDQPPGFYTSRLRTRYDLLDVLRITELATDDQIGRWEDAVKGGACGAEEFFDSYRASGARTIYYWALGSSDYIPGQDLLEEDHRAARRYYDTLRSDDPSSSSGRAA